MKIPVQVNIGKEYKEQVDKLVADMKAYGRKQVWEECTCNNCKWWGFGADGAKCEEHLFEQPITISATCENKQGIIAECLWTESDFGCNQWEVKDE